MDTEKLQENLFLTIVKQALNDFIHNFFLIAFAVSGILIIFGVEVATNYYKSERTRNFSEIFIDFTTNFWKKLFCGVIYMLLIWLSIFYVFTLLNTPSVLSVFVVPIMFVSTFITIDLIYSLIYTAYEEDYNPFRAIKICTKLLIVKPLNLLNIILIILFGLIIIFVPIAYLFLSIYFILILVKKYVFNQDIIQKIK